MNRRQLFAMLTGAAIAPSGLMAKPNFRIRAIDASGIASFGSGRLRAPMKLAWYGGFRQDPWPLDFGAKAFDEAMAKAAKEFKVSSAAYTIPGGLKSIGGG